MKALLAIVLFFIVSPVSADDQGLLEEINKARRSAGLPALVENPLLSESAAQYAELMAATGCFSHDCPPLGVVGDRLFAIGYNWSVVGEALAAGTDLASLTVREWLQSPKHRPIVLSPKAVEAGAAFAFNGEEAVAGGYGDYWVLVVAKP